MRVARDTVAAFLNAPEPRRGRVHQEHLRVAESRSPTRCPTRPPSRTADRFRVGPGDEIVVTEMEHHSNLVPWQLLAQRTGATFRWIPIDDEGRLVDSAIDEVITDRTKVVSFVHQSNALGTVNPVRAHRRAGPGGRCALGGRCRAVGATPSARRAESRRGFRRFTGHKLYGPTGRRRAVGSLRPARRAAGVPRRRRDDRDRRHDRHDVCRTAAPLRGRHADDRPGRWPRRGVDYVRATRHGQRPRPRGAS